MEPLDVRDVDERPAEGSAEEADAARAGYLGFVAHEVRNPLSTALWTAELLARLPAAERGGPRGVKLSAMCLRSILRVRQLIEDHFLAERLDAGGFALRVEPVVLADAIGAVLERRPADAPPATVRVDPGLHVDSDRTLLERAIDGLIGEAARDQTPVSIVARTSEGAVHLAISGRAADASALVDPVKGAPGDASGRALALPLARRIARVLGGTLAATDGEWRLGLPASRAHGAPPDAPRDP